MRRNPDAATDEDRSRLEVRAAHALLAEHAVHAVQTFSGMRGGGQDVRWACLVERAATSAHRLVLAFPQPLLAHLHPVQTVGHMGESVNILQNKPMQS